MTVNQRVSGSSPEGGAQTDKGFKKLRPFFISSFQNIFKTKGK